MSKKITIRLIKAVIFFGLSLLITGCGGPKVVYDPFKTPRDQFYPHLKKVALMPLKVPSNLEDPDPVKEKFESLLRRQLSDGGLTFVVVPSELEDSISKSYVEEVGGLYDPNTGEIDKEKSKNWRIKLYSEFQTRYDADAVLFSSIKVVLADFDNDKAKWHGTSQGVGKSKFLKGLLGVSHSGTLRALSLGVILSDINDTTLYSIYGGIEVLEKMGPSGSQPVPRNELFTDEKRNLKAVHLVLDPLLGIKKEE